MMKTSQLAFIVSGFAAVVAIGSLQVTRRANDRILKLEAENALLRTRMAETERDVLQALADRLDSLRRDLGLAPDTNASPTAEPFPEELVSKVGPPKKTGGEIHVKIPAPVMKAVLENQASLASEVRLSPVAKNQRPDGFQLFELREAGVVQALGFEQGDVIHSVNGLPFNDAEQALDVYELAMKASTLTFDVTRAGKPLALVVEVAP